ncbi:hypothetical protein [Peribacillus muralis]|uniref:hypothetical protein n=1 Tax=Peribacillus muralis TaxID=264697 RepID=UPI000B247198|nr:hypothetical protein [Peribacillus muralis]MCK1994212.1 hypothetical protein [Peribacillus muralis]MCK2015003.1 hypothetical protein [Peribacillus muralis]
MKKIFCKKVLGISVVTIIAFGNVTWSVSQVSKMAKQREIESFEQKTVNSSEWKMAE